MSAASPPPPPPPHITPIALARDHGNGRSEGGASAGQPRCYAHVKDIARSAEDQVNPSASIRTLLERVSNALSSAQSNMDFGRPDYSIQEYLVAQTILSHVIPTHVDSLQLKDQPRLRNMHSECIAKWRKSEPGYERAMSMVIRNNEESGVRPRADASNVGMRLRESESCPLNGRYSLQSGQRPHSLQPTNSREGHSVAQDKLPDYRRTIAGQIPIDDVTYERHRPQVHAKPIGLQGQQLNVNGAQTKGEDPLLSRFSQLRVSPYVQDSISSFPPDWQNPALTSRSSVAPQPELSISTRKDLSKDLPKLPSPTYSPAKILQDAPFMSTRDHQNESMAASEPTFSAPTASLSYQKEARIAFDESEQGSTTPSTISASEARVKGENMPQETEINAQRLFDYLKKFDVLLIDVRNREDFDTGHIWHQSIVCIEPAALRPNKSADELQETLVVGPDIEYNLFSSRHEFDLVVYLDQNTSSTDFLGSTANDHSPLRFLYESLYIYNDDKPLKWQPVLLTGGMTAWVDLIGTQSLQTSNTVTHRTGPVKPARPIARRPPASGSARLNVTKKRHRDYNPLAPEEERRWRERARSYSVVPEAALQEVAAGEGQDSVAEFQLRYPDVPALEYQAATSRPPSRPPPETLPPVSSYGEGPIPTVPSRPPPAVPRPSYRGVSQRVESQTLQGSRAAHLPHHIPNELRTLPRMGLYNFGVTCYMNATIQCLSATLPLSAFFLTDRFRASIQPENWKGSKGLLTGLYYKLIFNLWKEDPNLTIRPKHFREFCARLNREWGCDRQQDAKEFLEFVIDTLHEDFNVNWSRTPLRPLTTAEEASRELTSPFLASKREFARYQHRDLSKMSELFAGQHISRLQCTTCSRSSSTYETFYSISVEIPAPSRTRTVTIDDCLRSYCSSEMLSGDEVWKCPHCKKEREATKRITISRAPEFLVIHFKRFSASHSERARKVHTPVDFPLNGLDLEPYMLPYDRSTISTFEKTHGRGSFEAEVPAGMRPPYKYDAYAVMRHLGGTMTSGHYIALCKDQSKDNKWREFNDERVTDFRPEDLAPSKRLQNEQAYIVFYQRVPG